MKPLMPSFTVLSLMAAVLAAVASTTTLAWAGAFPPWSPSSSTAQVFNAALAEARGWSAVTLAVALPLSCFALAAARRGSVRGLLVQLGVLVYFTYTYLEMAVSPPFTPLYLVYIVAFSSAGSALIVGAGAVDVHAVERAIGGRAPRRTIAGFCAVFSAGLWLAWMKDIATRSARGEFGWPAGSAGISHVVQALDLGLQVPLGVATAVLLLRKRPVGLVLAAVTLTNGAVMGAALTAMVGVSSLEQAKPLLGAAPFALVPLASAVLALFLLARRPETPDIGSARASSKGLRALRRFRHFRRRSAV